MRDKKPSGEDILQSGYTSGAITKERLRKGVETLLRYQDGLKVLHETIRQNEEWYRMRHWSVARPDPLGRSSKEPAPQTDKASSAWLFSCIASKHADVMDNLPTCVCLPREESDEQDCEILSEIMPVVDDICHFEKVYSDEAWYKIKHGIACYSVMWDPDAYNGIGEISIKTVDVLNLFFDPAVTDIQDSDSVFLATRVSRDDLRREYPRLPAFKDVIQPITYYSSKQDDSDTAVVVDWYYHIVRGDGMRVLHHCKFVGDTVLECSEDNPDFADGIYEHGKYPFVLDVMYPEAGTAYGFGIININKEPQLYIDRLSSDLLDYANKAGKVRYFSSKQAGIDEKEFLNWDKPIVHVQGDVSEERLRQLTVNSVDAKLMTLLNMKIDEMKETSANRDVSNGGSGGTTTAAGIAALQEAGNKNSRDIIRGTYFAYQEVQRLKLELIRQFYTEDRQFRIVGENGSYRFRTFNSNGSVLDDGSRTGGIAMQETGRMEDGTPMYRIPIIDIDVRSVKKNPFDQSAQNQTVIELYKMGFFNPQNAQMSLSALEAMNFDGIEQIRRNVSEGETLYKTVEQLQMQIAQLRQILGMRQAESTVAAENQPVSIEDVPAVSPIQTAIDGAERVKTTPYAERLREQARA